MTFELESNTPKPDEQQLAQRLSARKIAGAQSITYSKSNWRIIAVTINSCLLLSLAVWLSGWAIRGALPNPKNLLPQLRHEPLQHNATDESFEFDYLGKQYTIEPLADYDLNGLIVSHNDPAGWGDIYHDEQSVDFRDICVLWGNNLNTHVFDGFQFWSEPWTCNAQTKSEAAAAAFDLTAIGNNHILSADDNVRKTITSARIGDQIHFSGKLINYYPSGMSEYGRKSSLTRSDTGNGACEVVFVKSAEILQRGPELGYNLFTYGRLAFAIFLIARIAIVLFVPYGMVKRPHW